MVHGVIADGVQLAGINASVCDNALVGKDVDDLADKQLTLGVIAHETTLKAHGQLINDGCVHIPAFCAVPAAAAELIGLLVAGNHAVNDMASDDPDSWYSRFWAEGYETTCIIEGLGQLSAVQNVYADHAINAILSQNNQL